MSVVLWEMYVEIKVADTGKGISESNQAEMCIRDSRRSLCILMDALMASLQEILKLSDKQLTAFTVDFEARLPEYLRNALHPEVAIA